jgi:hypothetical protein
MVSNSTADQTAGYLAAKIMPTGAGIVVSTVNAGGDEKLQIDATAVTEDHKVKVDLADATAQFLDDKVVVSGSVSKTIVPMGGGVNALQLSVPAIPAADDHLVLGSPTDATPGPLFGVGAKLVAGANITLNLLPGPSEQIQIVASGGGGGVPTIADRLMWVDGARVDVYVEDGSIIYPYKTLQAAVTAATALGGDVTIRLLPSVYSISGMGAYNILGNISLEGSQTQGVVIQSTDSDLQFLGNSKMCRLSNIFFDFSIHPISGPVALRFVNGKYTLDNSTMNDGVVYVGGGGVILKGFNNRFLRSGSISAASASYQLSVGPDSDVNLHQTEMVNTATAPTPGSPYGQCINVSTSGSSGLAKLTMVGLKATGRGDSMGGSRGVIVASYDARIRIYNAEISCLYNNAGAKAFYDDGSSPAPANDPHIFCNVKTDGIIDCNTSYAFINGYTLVTNGARVGQIIGLFLRGFPPRRDISGLCVLSNLSGGGLSVWERRLDKKIMLDIEASGLAANLTGTISIPYTTAATVGRYIGILQIENDIDGPQAGVGVITIPGAFSALDLANDFSGTVFDAGKTYHLWGNISIEVND